MRPGLVLATALLAVSAQAEGIVGTRTSISTTGFCRTNYRCTLKPDKQIGPFARSTLIIDARKPNPNDFTKNWQATLFTKAGVATSLLWEVYFQDDFYFPETERMLVSLSSTFLGIAVPKEALSKMVNDVMKGEYDLTKDKAQSPKFIIDAITGSEAGAHVLRIFFSQKDSYATLRNFEPPITYLNMTQKKAYVARIRAAVNGFEGDPKACPNYTPGLTLMYPGGGGVTYDSIAAVLRKLGFFISGGAWTLEAFPSSYFFILEQGKNLCVGTD